MHTTTGQPGAVIAGAVISSVVVIIMIIVAMVLIVISSQLYTRKSRKDIRIIKFTTSKISSLTEVLQIFKVYYITVTCIMYTQH